MVKYHLHGRKDISGYIHVLGGQRSHFDAHMCNCSYMETSVQYRPKNLDLSIVIQNWASLTPPFHKRLHPVCLSCSGFRWHWTLTDCWCDWTGSFMSDQGYDLWCAYDLLPDRKTSSDSHSVSEDCVGENCRRCIWFVIAYNQQLWGFSWLTASDTSR